MAKVAADRVDVLIDQFHQLDLARPNSATSVEVDAQCQPRQGLAAGWFRRLAVRLSLSMCWSFILEL
jgi:hypothetical protein